MHHSSGICHIAEWKIQEDISIGKDMAHSLFENSNSIKPSLSYGFILSIENILKIDYSKGSYHFKSGSKLLLFVWGSCHWDWIQILLKSRQGSLHESVGLHPRLGRGAAFLSATNCTHNKWCLDEREPGRNTSKDSSLKISTCINTGCPREELGALPTAQEAEVPAG